MPGAYILGIESSCDETAAAVVRSGEQLVSNVVASQIDRDITADTELVVTTSATDADIPPRR